MNDLTLLDDLSRELSLPDRKRETHVSESDPCWAIGVLGSGWWRPTPNLNTAAMWQLMALWSGRQPRLDPLHSLPGS